MKVPSNTPHVTPQLCCTGPGHVILHIYYKIVIFSINELSDGMCHFQTSRETGIVQENEQKYKCICRVRLRPFQSRATRFVKLDLKSDSMVICMNF